MVEVSSQKSSARKSPVPILKGTNLISIQSLKYLACKSLIESQSPLPLFSDDVKELLDDTQAILKWDKIDRILVAGICRRCEDSPYACLFDIDICDLCGQADCSCSKNGITIAKCTVCRKIVCRECGLKKCSEWEEWEEMGGNEPYCYTMWCSEHSQKCEKCGRSALCGECRENTYSEYTSPLKLCTDCIQRV
jgi:hypothetical protein